MTKPTFIIVGASKAGTTSLYQYLSQHPEISLSVEKEPHYFVREHRFSFPITDTQEKYLKLFAGSLTKEVGEASTAYLYFSGTAKRIESLLPDVKIIISLRAPIEIALSMWGHQVREGLEFSSFDEAIRQELTEGKRIINGVEYGFNYIQQARLENQVKEYLDVFGRDRVFFADFRELATSPSSLMKKLYQFLEVNDAFEGKFVTHFNRTGVPKSTILHKILNDQSFFRRMLVAPLRLFISKEKRHSLWNRLRDENIMRGTRHGISASTEELLQGLFESDQAAVEVYLTGQFQ